MADDKQEKSGKKETPQGAMNINPSPPRLPGVTDASPPRFLSWEEIQTAANGLTKMRLAHEVAVDQQFRLQRAAPAADSIEAQVKQTLHNAFWDLLRESLAADPPNYDQALVLLDDIKQNLCECLLAHHSRLKEEIEEVLDKEHIRQQVLSNTLDFKFYADFVVNMISKLCAPIRDDNVKELRQETDVVNLFRKILELLDLMKLDIANFTLSVFKTDITMKSIQYEKSEFKKFLNLQKENGVDGLEYTKQWLLRHHTEPTPSSNWYKILGKCYIDLLDWQTDFSNYPETVLMDRSRFTEIGADLHKLAVVASVVLVAADCSQGALQVVPDAKLNIKAMALNAVKETPLSELESCLTALAEKVVIETTEAMKKTTVEPLNGDKQSILYHTILQVKDPTQRIRQLVYNRMREFIESVIAMDSTRSNQIPGGLSWMHSELMALSARIVLLVKHNRDVFWEFYCQIFAEQDAALGSSQTQSQSAADKVEHT
ncbi:T-complex protein 11-like protein 1 isoform X2 [Nilaparvata lugens]|uniref:T-complex protein 11-like protein 1 isoform X1 n=1 Tax=Nilaparvata lugens TaxID=108931 RepID=UPI00193E1DE4|nr:T-complex protein 11-like protein 1 isoform X1 [Nilaparvata lugens]XP_039276743.1 T-complex protein 11-like protein 1 isoform X2 [Nilaparvata lugens]